MIFTSGLPFTAPGYKGGANINGKPVVAQGEAPQSYGGILSTNNTTASGGVFGVVLSRFPATPNELYVGLTTSGVVAGILQFDGGIAQNDPAHSFYPILGQPVAVGYRGPYAYDNIPLTATGAIAPVPGAVVIFNNTDGHIETLPSGSSAPTGWTVLNANVVNTDELGLQGTILQMNII
jgi:hypothetical protein